MKDKDDGGACLFLHQIIDSVSAPAQPVIFPTHSVYRIVALDSGSGARHVNTSPRSRSRDLAFIPTFGFAGGVLSGLTTACLA